MSLKIGIVGLPNVGKSTLFKALTKKQVDINNYPFCTIEPNVGIVEVPDERLQKLAKLSKSQKIIPAIIEFVDIAGLVKGASQGEGLGNKFLANIREVDAIVQVVRIFESEKITHVHNKINPEEDIATINTELVLADLETVNNRIQKLQKEIKGQDKEAVAKLEVCKKIKASLEKGELANITNLDLSDSNNKLAVQELSLLTMKPFLYVYNINNLNNVETRQCLVSTEMKDKPYIILDIKTEEDLDNFSEEEKKELDLESQINELIKKSYELLGLITFLTTGEKETRAWTVKKNSPAPVAGAAIHTDFQEKFICADIINWEKLLKAGSWSKAKELGWLRTEGKEYIVQDGDVIEFKF